MKDLTQTGDERRTYRPLKALLDHKARQAIATGNHAWSGTHAGTAIGLQMQSFKLKGKATQPTQVEAKTQAVAHQRTPALFVEIGHCVHEPHSWLADDVFHRHGSVNELDLTSCMDHIT